MPRIIHQQGSDNEPVQAFPVHFPSGAFLCLGDRQSPVYILPLPSKKTKNEFLDESYTSSDWSLTSNVVNRLGEETTDILRNVLRIMPNALEQLIFKNTSTNRFTLTLPQLLCLTKRDYFRSTAYMSIYQHHNNMSPPGLRLCTCV